LCNKLLPEEQDYNVGGLTRISFWAELEKLKNNKHYRPMELPFSNKYTGDDLKIFDNRKNWHPWQRDIFDKIWNPNGSYKKPDPTHIVSIVDTKGNSGKSSFFKWLTYRNPSTIGRLGYGSAFQLRSRAINIGQRDLYIVDLTRAKPKSYREEDLLYVLKDLKTGFITNVRGKTLLIPPPHIIVSSPYLINYNLLSNNRWETYRINGNKELKPML
jgi:hypothetical protein